LQEVEVSETKYVVTKVETCSVCEGDGWVQHPAWDAFFEDAGDDPVGPQATMQWFRDHGHAVWCANDLPPEEIECVKCGGTGEVREDVALEEALEAWQRKMVRDLMRAFSKAEDMCGGMDLFLNGPTTRSRTAIDLFEGQAKDA
jgi:hypothetical protein